MFWFYKVCASNFSGALFWNSSRRNLTVTQPCSALNPNFRSGVSITRRCNNDGTWSPVDVTACTMSIVSNPVIAVHFTVAFSDSSTMDSTTTISNVSSLYVTGLAKTGHICTNYTCS